MIKTFLILPLIIVFKSLTAQYTYRGQVIKDLTGKPMTFGNVCVRLSTPREPHIGTKITELDTHGYFNMSLKDSANVRITIDCGLDGRITKIVSYSDTLISFVIHTDCYYFNVDQAKNDIKEHKMAFLFNGIPSDTLTSLDKEFEKKYNIHYINNLDAPMMLDCIRLYNKTIAQYLDKEFGLSWRNEVRSIILFD